MSKFYPKRTIYPIAAGGAFTDIPVTLMFCRRMEIVECPPSGGTFNNGSAPYSPQGLNYKRFDDNYATIIGVPPGEIIPFGDDVAQGAGRGRPLGLPAMTDPAGQVTAARIIAKVACAVDTTTQVQVSEWV